MIALLGILQAATAGPTKDAAVRDATPLQAGADLITWHYDTPIHVEMYDRVPVLNPTDPGVFPLVQVDWTMGHRTSDALVSLTDAINQKDTRFAPQNVTYGVRPIEGGTGCNPSGLFSNCQTWEVHPTHMDGHPYVSPMDKNLNLAGGSVDWDDVRSAFETVVGSPLEVVGGHHLRSVTFASEPVTLREFLARSLHEGTMSKQVWRFIGIRRRAGGPIVYKLDIYPFKQRWLAGERRVPASEALTGTTLVHP